MSGRISDIKRKSLTISREGKNNNNKQATFKNREFPRHRAFPL